MSAEFNGGFGQARRLEIVAALANYTSPHRDYICDLPEFRKGSDVWAEGLVVAFELTDGTEIRRTRRPIGPWSAVTR